MPHEFEITNEDILLSEAILLSEGKHFDEERQVFIKNLDTLDLNAVPGSGKTTALLAKLAILNSKLPFRDGSGVLVISHTNAAVDEIKHKLGHHCSTIFQAPNFIGTIQSFVDQFLAVPYYKNIYRHVPIRIDNGLYYEQHKFLPYGLSTWLNNQRNKDELLYHSRLIAPDELVLLSGGRIPIAKTTASYKALVKLKEDIKAKGFLSFEDAYFLAYEYLDRIPNIIKLLQKRFRYVFVDEMQDMDEGQYQLLEKIFYDNGNSSSYFQRIGDRNQSIYTTENFSDTIWQPRGTILEINGSHRLSANIANIVKPFSFEAINIEGRNTDENGEAINIKPHLLVYTDTTISTVLPRYANLIHGLQQQGLIPIHVNNRFMAIGWTKFEEPGKTKISSYFPAFQEEGLRPRSSHLCLEDYLLQLDCSMYSFRLTKQAAMSGLAHLLRIENIKDDDGRNFSGSTLQKYLQDKMPEELARFNLIFYNLITYLFQRNYKHAICIYRGSAMYLLKLLNQPLNHGRTFFEQKSQSVPVFTNVTHSPVKNRFEQDDITIDISTVHASKGQTHTATLYLESFFKRGQGNYESQRLSNQFGGTQFTRSGTKTVNQSTKMVYVGFSRPTHLLCFAVHKDRFDAKLSDIDLGKWHVIQLS